MVSALNSGSSGLGSSHGWGYCVVFLGKILLNSHTSSLYPGVGKWVPANCQGNQTKILGGGGLPAMD